MTTVVYVKPVSIQCTATYRALDAKGLDYEVHDVLEEDAALEKVKSLGYLQAPVVVTEWDHWSGFRQDKINQLAEVLRLQKELSEAIAKLQSSGVKDE